MAEKKKKRTVKKKPNPIDTGVKKVRDLAGNVKKTVAGSEEVGKVKKAATGAVEKAKSKVPGLKKGAQSTAKKAKAATDAATAKAKSVTGGPAARANAAAAARNAGPTQPKKPEYRRTGAAGGQATGTTTGRTRAQAQADFDKPPPKPSVKQRIAAKGLRVGGPLAAAGLVEPAAQYAADVSQFGTEEAGRRAGEGATRTLRDAPGAIKQFGRDLINEPGRTAVDVVAGAADVPFNAAVAGGNVAQAGYRSLVEGKNFGEEYEKLRGASDEVLRDPFSRFADKFQDDGTDTGVGRQPIQRPQKVPGTEQPLPAAAGGTAQQRGLRGAVGNREFLADKAKGFRTGFDVLQEAGHQRTGGIGDVAAYNAATGIARRGNQAERATREMNIEEAKARSDIEGQDITNALNVSKTAKARADTDAAFRKDLAAAGKGANAISEKMAALQRQATGGFFDDDVAAAELGRLEDTTINQALESNFDPLNENSIAASNLLTDKMAPLMDRGVIQGLIDAATNSNFDLGDMLNDNDELVMNRQTMENLTMIQSGNDTVFAIDMGEEVVPLFPTSELDPKFRDQLSRIADKTPATRSLRNAR